jgi:hypothetical protein
MFRFTIRDVLWLMVVVGLGVAIAIQHQKASNARKRVSAALNVPATVDFVEMPIDEAMLFISVKQGVPIFFEGNWEGRTVTAKLTNLPLRDILEGILPPLDLDYQVEDGWILIKPRDP